MPHISSALRSKTHDSHFCLQKTPHHVEISCKDFDFPKIACQPLTRLSVRDRRHIQSKRLVVIDSSSCSHGCSKKAHLNKVAIDVKRLAKQLRIDEKETLCLLQSSHVFEKLSLIAYAMNIAEAARVEFAKQEDKLPVTSHVFAEKIRQALTLAINHDIIRSQEDVTDAFKPNPTSIAMAWCHGDQSIKIARVIAQKTFRVTKSHP